MGEGRVVMYGGTVSGKEFGIFTPGLCELYLSGVFLASVIAMAVLLLKKRVFLSMNKK